MRKTVGENQNEMRELAIALMRDNYKAADYAAKEGRLQNARDHLTSAERWRIKARSRGAQV